MNLDKNINGKAHGKLILLGEHSVVYGKPAIALPFDKVEISCSIIPVDNEIQIDCAYFVGELKNSPIILRGVKELVNKTLEYLEKESYGINIVIKSNLPSKRGLGSSAAVSVAIVRALFHFYGEELPKDTLLALVDIAERIHHLRPSGVDSSTITHGRALFFVKNEVEELFDVHMDAYLLVADTGEEGNTGEAVEEVEALYNEKADFVKNIMNDIGELTIKAKTNLMENNIKDLGENMNLAQSLLKKLNVSNDSLDKYIDISLENGAIGAKLTGSGKGGCLIALCMNYRDAYEISKKLRDNGVKKTWITYLKDIEDDE